MTLKEEEKEEEAAVAVVGAVSSEPTSENSSLKGLGAASAGDSPSGGVVGGEREVGVVEGGESEGGAEECGGEGAEEMEIARNAAVAGGDDPMEMDSVNPAMVFCIRLKQPRSNLMHKMSVPELCRNFSVLDFGFLYFVRVLDSGRVPGKAKIIFACYILCGIGDASVGTEVWVLKTSTNSYLVDQRI